MTSWQTTRLKLRLQPRRHVDTDFPFNDPTLISDIEWSYGAAGRFHSGSLGTITESQAVTVTRSTNNDLAENSAGLLVKFAANAARHTEGRGLWSDTSATCRVDFNGDLTNAAWTKDNCTADQLAPSPFADGSVPGCYINVTLDGDATCLQTLPVFSGSDESLPSGRFYLDSAAPLSPGCILEITQDGIVWTDITNQLVADRWVRLAGTSQAVTLTTDPFGIRLRNAVAGDKIGFMLGNVSRGYVMSGDIYTPGTATVNRSSDIVKQNTPNFPSLQNLSQFTLIIVCVPIKKPLPAQGDFVAHPRNGWTVWEMNNPYDVRATSTEASLAPYGGPGEGSLLTVGGVVTGDWAQDLPTTWGSPTGLKLAGGTGAGARQEILEQISGTPGGAGTYRVYSDVYPDGQTTGTIVLNGRAKVAQGLALNAAQKPDDPERPGISRVGMTVTAEPNMQDFGNDPQHEDVNENGVNSEVVTFDLDAKEFSIVLNGDIELSNPVQFTERPMFDANYEINLGSQYPQGGPLNGHTFRYVLLGRRVSNAEAIQISLDYKAYYDAILNGA